MIGVIVNESAGTLYVMGVANAILPQRVRDTLDMLIAFGFRNCKAEPWTQDHSKFAKVTNSTFLSVLGK